MKDFIAGTTLEGALEQAEEINRRGLSCSLSYLPTIKVEPPEIESEIEEYREALDAIRDRSLRSDITIKLHQLGIYGDLSLCDAAVRRIVEHAERSDIFVWVDMERPETVGATLKIYLRLLPDHRNVGICLQAYLTRTAGDLAAVLSREGIVRLVKGFYKGHDIESWEEVTRNYERLMYKMLLESRRPAVATHDLRLIEKAIEFSSAKRTVPPEFQFFMGVRDEFAQGLHGRGYAVRIYIPYGKVLRYWIDGAATFDWRRQLQRLAGLRPLP